MKILLVEDNEMNRDMLSRRLTRRGYQVVTAVDGEAGIAAVHAEQPDMVLMDMSLPLIDGWEATRRLKADPRTAHIPVIALTAHAMAEDRVRALDAGCDDFDTKPVELDRLCQKITALAPVAANAPPQVLQASALADLDAVVVLVADACKRVGASAEQAADLRLAVEEVFVNIVRHGYAGDSGPITVEVDATRERIVVRLIDQAPAFDPVDVAASDIGASLEARSVGGLGWHLVRQVMDDVRREPASGGGNQFILLKRLQSGAQAGRD